MCSNILPNVLTILHKWVIFLVKPAAPGECRYVFWGYMYEKEIVSTIGSCGACSILPQHRRCGSFVKRLDNMESGWNQSNK